jgi:methionine synthase II (cobalamin-independent)
LSTTWSGATYAATGVGSMPGTDPVEAVAMVLALLPDLPFLPELPARGPHADLAGRSAALLADLPVDLQPAGWRLTSGRSRDAARARDLLAYDLDALEQAADDPPALKLQCAGPWTLAALLELPKGDRVLADPGAVDDLAQSLAEGLSRHLADVAARLPRTRLVLQLDEPSLPAVLTGGIPTASGFGRLRAPTAERVTAVLARVLAQPGAADTVVHCCAPSPPVALLRRAGAGAFSLDATLLTPRDDDALGEVVEQGAGLLLGVVPSTDGRADDLRALAEPAAALWRRLGQPPEQLGRTVVITPTCGMAGATAGHARRALQASVEIARRLGEAAQ